jgi:hypothetical protein
MAIGDLLRAPDGNLRKDSLTGNLRRKRALAFIHQMRRRGNYEHVARSTYDASVNDRGVAFSNAVNSLSDWSASESLYANSTFRIRHRSYLAGALPYQYWVHEYYARVDCYYESGVVSADESALPIKGVSFKVSSYKKSAPNPTYYVSATVATDPFDRGLSSAWAIGTYNTVITGNGEYEILNPAANGWGALAGRYLILCAYIEGLEPPYDPDGGEGDLMNTVNSNHFRVSTPSIVYAG